MCTSKKYILNSTRLSNSDAYNWYVTVNDASQAVQRNGLGVTSTGDLTSPEFSQMLAIISIGLSWVVSLHGKQQKRTSQDLLCRWQRYVLRARRCSIYLLLQCFVLKCCSQYWRYFRIIFTFNIYSCPFLSFLTPLVYSNDQCNIRLTVYNFVSQSTIYCTLQLCFHTA